MTSHSQITQLLESAVSGDRKAANELFSVVYEELRRIAGDQMRRESSGHTLQSTALVHEVWIRLLGRDNDLNWKDRGHFFAAAAMAMRRILVDAARARKRKKRGGGQVKHPLRDDDLVTTQDDELLALDEALDLFRSEDETKAKLVELRYFAGFTNAQAAEQLGISTATAERYWTFSRAWLRAKMES